jgi:hypothetical protein
MRTQLTKKYILKKFEISCPLRYLQDPDGVILRFFTCKWRSFYPSKTVISSDADPNPVGSGPFWSDPDPDFWDRIRIRILALINVSVSTFLVRVKDMNTYEIYAV